MKRVLAVLGLGALVAIGLGLASPALTDLAAGRDGPAPKVFVCKYVGQPGVDERLQTGDNPISVSANSIKEWNGENPGNLIGLKFPDAQGNSIVIAIDEGQAEPDVSACPTPPGPTKGQLIVNKVVVNDDGGTKTASDFSFTVDGTLYAFEADGSNQLVLDPGDYTVGEVAVEGYTSSGGGVATVVIGQTVTVTITNDDVPAYVMVGDASVSCVLPEGYYRVNGTVDGQAADQVEPATIPGDFAGTTEVTVTRGDTSVRKTVTTDGNCSTAKPPVVPPTETTPTETTPTETTPTETTPTETTPAETTPTAPLTPPTTTKKPVEKKAPAKAKPAPLTPPKKAVAGVQKQAAAQAEAQPKLAYTP